MSRLNEYIQKLDSRYLSQQLPLDFRASIVVVIPCYDEDNLETTLESLRASSYQEVNTIVLVVINSGVHTEEKIKSDNREIYNRLKTYSEKQSTDHILFTGVIFEDIPKKHAGVGFARKIGMDIAVQYYAQLDNEINIIVSLDADCTVSSNYFERIYKTYLSNNKICCTIHNFLHRVEDNSEIIIDAVSQYEKYLRLFEDALKYCGFPYYYHTIGSAFAVTADAYVRVGGMGRQQGGEDFYFLQKVFSYGKVEVLEDVFVYPLARFSERVPFGTGPAIQKIIEDPDKELKVYSLDAFIALKYFFDIKDAFYNVKNDEILKMLDELHPSLRMFIIENNFTNEIDDCNKNSATLKTFQKRFFHHFNAFRIIKYLNYSHNNGYFSFEGIEISINRYSKLIVN